MENGELWFPLTRTNSEYIAAGDTFILNFQFSIIKNGVDIYG